MNKKVEMRGICGRSADSRVRGFDMPVTLTINGHDGSGLFEFHYDPDNENTEE